MYTVNCILNSDCLGWWFGRRPAGRLHSLAGECCLVRHEDYLPGTRYSFSYAPINIDSACFKICQRYVQDKLNIFSIYTQYTQDITKKKAPSTFRFLVGPAIRINAKLQICHFCKSSLELKTTGRLYIWGVVWLIDWLYAMTRDVQVRKCLDTAL